MDFEEHAEEVEEESGSHVRSQNLEAVANSGRPREGRRNGGSGGYRYRECLKNQAVGIGRLAVDGCGEFMPAGDEGTLEALRCAACNCHRNFHRKVPEVQQENQATFHHHQMAQPAYYHHHNPSGYLHVMTSPPSDHQRPLALPPTSRDDVEEISNPSSSGGGSKKRFRTKFTQYQKDRMLAFSEASGWRIQKEDEGSVQQFCAETGISRQVLKVWMHNNKHTLGKKP
ncbi:hypothetical protein L1887_23867 [Cichorium endivia]|nr:hypothetical protein L1887_23867 [Cichorium endivia]